jgi:cytochrome c oxidase subunit 1/cytochrome c oxidase subunit I+III
MIFANLAWSRVRGAPSGPDPFFGGTLEWTTSSPPPPYNFPVVPTVTSPYPNWDVEDREADAGRLAEGTLVLDRGHETPSSTVRDGTFDEILEMPSESWAPIALAASVTLAFTMLLTLHYVAAALFVGLAGLTAAAWHAHEPQEG